MGRMGGGECEVGVDGVGSILGWKVCCERYDYNSSVMSGLALVVA